MDGRRRHLPRVAHENPHIRAVATRLDEAAFNGKPADPGKDVAAILRVGDDGLIDKHLKEQIVDVGICATGARDHGHLAGQRAGAPHAVDLPDVRRSHHPQQQLISRGGISGQVVGQKIPALRGAAPHPHASCTGVRHDLSSVPSSHPRQDSAHRRHGAIKAWQGTMPKFYPTGRRDVGAGTACLLFLGVWERIHDIAGITCIHRIWRSRACDRRNAVRQRPCDRHARSRYQADRP